MRLPFDRCLNVSGGLQRSLRTFALCSLTFFLVGCSIPYRGDGVFTDPGWTTVYRFYGVDFGLLEKDATTVSYRMYGLPAADFSIGLRVGGRDFKYDLSPLKEMDVGVEIVLLKSSGETVFHEKGSFRDMNWTNVIYSSQDAYGSFVLSLLDCYAGLWSEQHVRVVEDRGQC